MAIFIGNILNHNSRRKSKKTGMDEDLANEVAEKIKAKLVLGELNIEKIEEPCPIFKDYAELWLSLPHDLKSDRLKSGAAAGVEGSQGQKQIKDGGLI